MEIDIKRLREQFRIPWNRKFVVVKKDVVHMGGRYWSGGSKDEYYILRAFKASWKVPDAPFPNPSDKWDEYTLENEEAILKLGSFCGKPATPVLYIRTTDTYVGDKKTIEREY